MLLFYWCLTLRWEKKGMNYVHFTDAQRAQCPLYCSSGTWVASLSPGSLLEVHIPRPPDFLNQVRPSDLCFHKPAGVILKHADSAGSASVLGGAWDSAFLTSSHMMPVLSAHRQYTTKTGITGKLHSNVESPAHSLRARSCRPAGGPRNLNFYRHPR